MSSYEDYLQTSKSYDATRVPIGIEILLGCLARGPKPLSEITLLDAGCGTGSYSQALLPYVGRIEAVDLNPGMLEVAEHKLAERKVDGRIAFHQAPIDALPFEAQSFDGIMINQVMHHLPDDPGKGYPALRRVFSEFARVLREGGVLIVNTCSHEQLRRGWWYLDLIPEAVERVCERHIPMEDLFVLLGECDFGIRGRFVPLDAVMQGEAYFNSRGPLEKQWRDGDSIWALVTDGQLERVLGRVRELDAEDELDEYFTRNDARRPQVGQFTFVFASRAANRRTDGD